MAPKSGSRSLNDPYPNLSKPHLTLVKSDMRDDDNPSNVTFENGVLKIDNPDGTTTIDFAPSAADLEGDDTDEDNGFDANLALKMGEEELGAIASELLVGVDSDEQSRKEWLETRALGIQLLGLKLEKPRQDMGSSSAPLEGMSTVRHPLLLEATVSFQATARAELLPAGGPVKVRNDTPVAPRHVLPQANQADPTNPYPSLPPPSLIASNDVLAQALEQDLNHYLTAVATEYIPDTDRMLFNVGFGGDGFKKVFNCPLRNRPVSESVDAEDLIVSNHATDLSNCGRITHKIKMRYSTLRRMQILKVYRDVELSQPQSSPPSPVDVQKDKIAGYNPSVKKPEDRDYEIYEIYCELDLDDFAPKRFKNKGLPLPYRVTIDKQSRQVLDIRRNWKEDDKDCIAKQYFVQFPMVRGLGFYGLGYIHLLGNTTIALTASWRLQLDNGMFSNFPGFLYAKGIGRQLTNQFRVPPGGGVGLEIGAQQSIKDAVMPLPYKETGPSFTQFSTHVEEVGRRMAQTANIQVGEGKQDAPVGTTLALIEQATKVMDSAHKRLHAAQAQEFQLLVERFREDPEAFWRHNKSPAVEWQKDQFLEALDNYNIVPVADPNNPTSLHRLAKAQLVKELQKGNPLLYDPIGVDLRVMQITDIDPQGLFRPTPATPAPDPRLEAIKEKANSVQKQNEIQLLEAKIKAGTAAAQIQDKQADRDSRERIENTRMQLEAMDVQKEMVKAGQQMQIEREKALMDLQLKSVQENQKLAFNHAAKMQELQHSGLEKQHSTYADAAMAAADQAREQQKHQFEMGQEHQKHQSEMSRTAEKHSQDMELTREKHQAEIAKAKALAKVTKANKPAKPKASKKGK